MPSGNEGDMFNVVCPPVEDLLSENSGKCTCSLCGKIISNSSALKLHLVKAHRTGDVKRYEKGGISTKVKTVYCCPVPGCPRGAKNINRHFRNIWHVKQHYLNCHAERQHQCPKCKAKFGTVNRLKQHQKSCGQTFTCSCGCPFTTREALLTHARIQGHSHGLEVHQKDHSQESCRAKKTSTTSTVRMNDTAFGKSRDKQLVAVPMLLLLRKDDLQTNKPRTIVPIKPKSTNDHVMVGSKPIVSTSNIGTGSKQQIRNFSEEACRPTESCTKSQHEDNKTTNSLHVLTHKDSLVGSEVEVSNSESISPGSAYDVSDAFTQTKEQTYGNQISQTGLSYSDLAETQTQTVSLEDLLDYQFNDAFTQTCKVDGIATQSEHARLSEIETQTTEIMNLLQENVSDAFTQTLQHGISDQCSQTNSSLFNMITGTTQTKSLSGFQNGYSHLSSVQSCNAGKYDLFSNNATSALHSRRNTQAYSSHPVFSNSVTAMDSEFTDSTEYSSDDPLNDAFTQTWSQCSIDQFSQTNWSDYIEQSFLENADVGFTSMEEECTDGNTGVCVNRKSCSDATTSYNSNTDDGEESLNNRLCSSLLDSCTQTTLSFKTMIDLAYEEDNREMLTPSPYLADAGTQTPAPINSSFH